MIHTSISECIFIPCTQYRTYNQHYISKMDMYTNPDTCTAYDINPAPHVKFGHACWTARMWMLLISERGQSYYTLAALSVTYDTFILYYKIHILHWISSIIALSQFWSVIYEVSNTSQLKVTFCLHKMVALWNWYFRLCSYNKLLNGNWNSKWYSNLYQDHVSLARL